MITRQTALSAAERIGTVTQVYDGALMLTHLEFTSGGKPFDLIDYMALNRVTALLMLKDGKIAYEDYEMDNTEQTRWMSRRYSRLERLAQAHGKGSHS